MRNKRFLLVLGILILAVVFVISSFSLYLVFVFLKKPNDDISMSGLFLITKFNRVTNATKKEFVVLSEQLTNEDFISYRSSDNNIFSTITRITSSQFECFGTCSCNNNKNNSDNSRDRRNVNILSKSIYILISAVSLNLAVQIARNYFKEECLMSLSECDDDLRISDVGDCEEVDYDDFDEDDEFEDEGESDEYDSLEIDKTKKFEEYDEQRAYQCIGHCLPNFRIKNEIPLKEQVNMNCEEHVMDAVMLITASIKSKVKVMKLHGADMGDKYYKEVAERRYVVDKLEPFCRDMSFFEYFVKIEKTGSRIERGVYLCSAHTGGSKAGANNKNSNGVKCELINRINGKIPSYNPTR